jgi:hypothetical protein
MSCSQFYTGIITKALGARFEATCGNARPTPNRWSSSRWVSRILCRDGWLFRLMIIEILSLGIPGFDLCMAGTVPAKPVKAVKEWNGEFFKKKEGAVFVKTIASGFPATASANVMVTLFGIIEQQSYTFSNAQTAADVYPREIWKFVSGKYRIDRVDFIDQSGVKRAWVGDPKAPFVILIPRIMLSNLGVWALSPVGKDGLSIKFSMTPNTYQEKGAAKDSSVAAVVNGFTGTIQQVIGGKKIIDGAENDYSSATSLRSTATFARQIGMYYKVDLFKHNQYSKDLMASLAAFDLNLRTCYIKALDSNSKLKGDLVFQVITSAVSGTIRQARKSKGTVSDGAMIDCLIAELQQIPMPVQENMIGELSFQFDVK